MFYHRAPSAPVRKSNVCWSGCAMGQRAPASGAAFNGAPPNERGPDGFGACGAGFLALGRAFDNRRQMSKGPTLLVWRSLLDGLADGVDVFLHGRRPSGRKAETEVAAGARVSRGRVFV
jgi:hypothetical protein